MFSLCDPEGFVWAPPEPWNKTAILEPRLERTEGGGTREVPQVAKAFAAKGWKIVDHNPKAPRSRTDAERRGVPLVQTKPAAKKPARKKED